MPALSSRLARAWVTPPGAAGPLRRAGAGPLARPCNRGGDLVRNAYDVGFEDLLAKRQPTGQWSWNARTTGARNFTFATSGSTGKRQQISTVRHVDGEAQAWAGIAGRPNASDTRRLAPHPPHLRFIWGVLLPTC
jgi:hypothetical protein